MTTTAFPLFPLVCAALALTLGCVPPGIYGAIQKDPEAFPGKYARVAPISDDSLAGLMGTVEDLGGGKGQMFVADAPRCFISTATVSGTGVAIKAKYDGSKTSDVELSILENSVSKALGEIGIDLDVSITRSTRLETGKLINETLYLVPNPSGECDFNRDSEKQYRVVRKQIRATELMFSSGTATNGAIGVNVPVEELVKIGAKSGWSFSSDRTLTGSNLIVAVKLETVKVEVTRETLKAQSIKPGIDLVKALGFKNRELADIRLIYRGASQTAAVGDPKMVLLPNSTFPSLSIDSEALNGSLCTLGEETEVGTGDVCYFVQDPGNTLISFSWTAGVDPASGADTIEVSIASYKTVLP